MQIFFGNLKLLSGISILFIITVVTLLLLFMVQVPCPVCSSAVTDSSDNSLKVIEIKAERGDITICGKCEAIFIIVDYEVYISVVNEGSKSISAPLFITGRIPDVKLGEEMVFTNAKLIYVEVPAEETEIIQEQVEITIIGNAAYTSYLYLAGLVSIPEVEFSIITDPETKKLNCPVCSGKGSLSLIERIRLDKRISAIVQ